MNQEFNFLFIARRVFTSTAVATNEMLIAVEAERSGR